MPTFAAANNASLRIFEEVTWAATPSSPAMTELKYTGESLNHNKETVESSVIRSDRMRDDLLQVGVGAEGDINFEFCFADLDLLIEGAMMSDFVVATTGIMSIDANTTSNKFIRTTGSFIVDGFVVGCWIRPSGYVAAGNNAVRRVTAVSALELTVDDTDTTLVTEAGTGNEKIDAKFIKNGTTLKSYLIEKAFTDISKFVYFLGCRVNQMQLSITAKEIVTGSFGMMGQKGVSGASSIGTTTAAGIKTALTASANVGTVTKDNVALASYIKTLNFTLGNNIRSQDAIGNLAHVGLTPGFSEAKGTIEFFLSDLDMYQAMENHTSMALSMRFTDPSGNVMILTLPKIYLAKSTANSTGGNTDVMLSCEMSAVRDSVSGCLIQIDSLAA